MTPKNHLIFKSLGLALILLGIILNPVVLGKFLTMEGQIEQIGYLIIIFLFQVVISAFGLFIFLFPKFLVENWRLLLSFFMGIVLAFIVVEFTARFFLDRPAFGWYGYPSGLYIPDATKGERFTPNFRGYFLNPPYDGIPININDHGLRDTEHQYKKPDEVFRILGLGDSVTFGSGIFLEETYLYQLEQLLQQGGVTAEVIKSGVNSYKFDQEYTYYIEDGYKYSPDVVIVGFLDKDIIPVPDKEVADLFEKAKIGVKKTNTEKDKQGFISKVRLLCRSCDVLYNLLSFASNNWANSEGGWDEAWKNPSNLEHLQKKLADLNQRLKRNGQQLIIVMFPTTDQFASDKITKIKYQDRLMELTKKENIPVLDLFPFLNVPEYYRYYLGGDSAHLNASGNQLAAKAIKEFILSL